MSQEPITLRRFADQIGVSERVLLRWCRAGKVVGARKHPLTKKWTIYPPAKLALDAMTGNSLCKLPGYVAPNATAPKPAISEPHPWKRVAITSKGGAA